jgi:FtsH-binding integral membrane protein
MAFGADRIVVSRDAQVQAEFDAGLRAHMLRVYNYMASGVALTGIVAYVAAQSGIYASLAQTPLIWVVVLAPIALVWFLAARLDRLQLGTAQTLYWVYAALVGLSLGYIFLRYSGVSIARTFFITAGTFAAMSLWGYTTKKDLSGFGSFLLMGLIGIIIAGLVNLFMQSSALHFAISVIGVLVFVGLTAYDTQRIKSEYAEHYDHDTIGKLAIMGALTLYLDFINLFVMLLQLFGGRKE